MFFIFIFFGGGGHDKISLCRWEEKESEKKEKEKKKRPVPYGFVSKPFYIFDQLLCLRLKLICGYCLHASDHLLGVLVFAYLVIQRLYICADVPSGRLVLNEIQCWSRAKKINIQSCLL